MCLKFYPSSCVATSHKGNFGAKVRIQMYVYFLTKDHTGCWCFPFEVCHAWIAIFHGFLTQTGATDVPDFPLQWFTNIVINRVKNYSPLQPWSGFTLSISLYCLTMFLKELFACVIAGHLRWVTVRSRWTGMGVMDGRWKISSSPSV